MSKFTTFQKVLLGVSSAGGAALYYINVHLKGQKVHASWTTDYKPSTKWDDNWDLRAPKSLVHPRKLANEQDDNVINEKLANSRPNATRHIILIRHGQYNMNGKSDGERVLTLLGKEQAMHTGKRLKELDLPYTDLIKSTMSRAQETGSIISDVLPNSAHCFVRGPLYHLNRLWVIGSRACIYGKNPFVFRYVQQYYEDGARIEAAFRKYFHRADPKQEYDSYTILVCHANVIRYFVCRALQFPPEAWLRLSLNHASISWVSITPSGRVILRALGDSGHIPVNLITSQ